MRPISNKKVCKRKIAANWHISTVRQITTVPVSLSHKPGNSTIMEIKAKVTFDESSHLGAFRLHMWHRYRTWLMIRTTLSGVILFAGAILIISEGLTPLAVLMLMIGTFAMLRPMIWKIMHARNLRKLPGYGQAVIYTFTEKNFSILGEDMGGTVKWDSLLETVQTKTGLLLYHGKKSYTWLPATSFDSIDEMQQVATWAMLK